MITEIVSLTLSYLHLVTRTRTHRHCKNKDDKDDSDVPLAKLAKRLRKQREASSDEEDIPLMGLAQCLRAKIEINREVDQNVELEVDAMSVSSEAEEMPVFTKKSEKLSFQKETCFAELCKIILKAFQTL